MFPPNYLVSGKKTPLQFHCRIVKRKEHGKRISFLRGTRIRTNESVLPISCDLESMMLLCGFSISTPTCSKLWLPIKKRGSSRKPFRCSSDLACTSGSVADFSGVLQNKVLVSAAISAAIGQFSKPFTSSLLYGKQFNWKAAVEAGGFPSTHSSAAVATATSLLLDRGFSDSIFGLAVVYASLVMYDAQGVRREVGNHSRALNRLAFTHSSEESTSEEEKTQSNRSSVDSDAAVSPSPLKESIGHTQVEVVAGALLGFFVSLAVCPAILSLQTP